MVVNSNKFDVEEAVEHLNWEEEEHPDAGFKVAYSPALRDEIRAMAKHFLKSVPLEKRRGAAAMPVHGEKK